MTFGSDGKSSIGIGIGFIQGVDARRRIQGGFLH